MLHNGASIHPKNETGVKPGELVGPMLRMMKAKSIPPSKLIDADIES